MPRESFVFCNFNSSHKITPKIFDIWMEILKNVPDSVLWLLKSNSLAAENLWKEAKKRNIEKAKFLLAKNSIKILKSSNFYETYAWPNKNHPKFYNIVIKIITKLKPMNLFFIIKDIEKKLGRKKTLINRPRICDIDILDLDISKITDQYLEYIELMDSLKFELAADYLVMAATLAEIKSRLMLPKESFEDEEEDPRAALIKRLQEYKRFKIVSEKIAILPRVDRDFFIASAKVPKLQESLLKEESEINITDLFTSVVEVLNRPNYKNSHLIDFEELSTKERIQILLDILNNKNIISFSKTLRKPEGKKGVVVTLLASLELAKDGYIELIQNKSEELFIKSVRGI